MESREEYQYFKLNNLQARMDKCTNEQFWVVTTILALNAVFLSSDFIRELEVYKGWLIISLLLLISIYGVWFVIKRHISFYLYRREFADIFKEIDDQFKSDNISILSKKPKRNSINTLSGVIFYTALIILSSIVTIIFILSSILFSKGNCCIE